MNVLASDFSLYRADPVPLVSAAATPAPTAPATTRRGIAGAGPRTGSSTIDGIGLSIGVYDDGKSRFYNFGTTQLEGNRPPTKDTVYEIGSISKTIDRPAAGARHRRRACAAR